MPSTRRSLQLAPSWATLVLALMLVPLPAFANLIVNAGFDIEVPRNDTGGGWTSENIDGLGGWLGLGVPPPGFRLNTAPGPASTIEQTVEGLLIGETYFIHGDYALGFGGGPPDDSFLVTVDGGTIASLGPAPNHDPGGSTFFFDEFDASFVATATTHVIGFVGQANGSDHDYTIDNICMDTVQCVPEPSTVALLAAALGFVSIAARRRA